MDLSNFLQSERDTEILLVDEFLKGIREKNSGLTNEYGELLEILHEYVLCGGKWHRPALALLVFKGLGGKVTKKERKAVAGIELLHRYILIHDDIIDRDLTRHGQDTIEKKYQDIFKKRFKNSQDEMFSKGMAIVAGDILNSFSHQIVMESGLSEKICTNLLKAFEQIVLETAAGWQLQTMQNFMDISEVEKVDFMKGLTLVSSQYSMVWPIRIGQILAGKELGDWDKDLDNYGDKVGKAYQIQDDILGMFGKEEETGKPVGHDFREGKKTLLILDAYKDANDEERKFLVDNLGKNFSATVLSKAQKIMIETKALEKSQKLAEDYITNAKKTIEGKGYELLERLADYILSRKK